MFIHLITICIGLIIAFGLQQIVELFQRRRSRRRTSRIPNTRPSQSHHIAFSRKIAGWPIHAQSYRAWVGQQDACTIGQTRSTLTRVGNQLQLFHIGEISQSSHLALICDEICFRDKWN